MRRNTSTYNSVICILHITVHVIIRNHQTVCVLSVKLTLLCMYSENQCHQILHHFTTNDSEPTEVISQPLINDGKLSEQLSIVYMWETNTIRFLIENLERCSHIRYTVNCCQQVVYPCTDCYEYVSWHFLLWWDQKLFIVVPIYLLYHFNTIIVYLTFINSLK